MPGSKEPESEDFSIMGAGGRTSRLEIEIPSITGKIMYAWDGWKLYSKTSSVLQALLGKIRLKMESEEVTLRIVKREVQGSRPTQDMF